jgi:hypothetical protein
MNRSAELDLALDVDDFSATQPHACCDPDRIAEGEIAKLQNRKAIDLANFLAGSVDEDRATLDFLLQPIAEPVGAILRGAPSVATAGLRVRGRTPGNVRAENDKSGVVQIQVVMQRSLVSDW